VTQTAERACAIPSDQPPHLQTELLVGLSVMESVSRLINGDSCQPPSVSQRTRFQACTCSCTREIRKRTIAPRQPVMYFVRSKMSGSNFAPVPPSTQIESLCTFVHVCAFLCSCARLCSFVLFCARLCFCVLVCMFVLVCAFLCLCARLCVSYKALE
jgi:hypothetical protein